MHYAKQPVKCYTWLFKETWSCDLTICLTWKISMHTYTSRLCELSLFETKCKAHPRFSFFRFFCNLALSYLHSATKKKHLKCLEIISVAKFSRQCINCQEILQTWTSAGFQCWTSCETKTAQFGPQNVA